MKMGVFPPVVYERGFFYEKNGMFLEKSAAYDISFYPSGSCNDSGNDNFCTKG